MERLEARHQLGLGLFVELCDDRDDPVFYRLVGQAGLIHLSEELDALGVFTGGEHVGTEVSRVVRLKVSVFVEPLAVLEAFSDAEFGEAVAIFIVCHDVTHGRRVLAARAVVEVGEADHVLTDGSLTRGDVDGVVLVGEVKLLRLEDERVGRDVEGLSVAHALVLEAQLLTGIAVQEVRPRLAARRDVLLDTIVDDPRVGADPVEFEVALRARVKHLPSVV